MTLIACFHPRQCRTLLSDILISTTETNHEVVLPTRAYIAPQRLQSISLKPHTFRRNDAGINGKTFIASQPCLHAPDPHVFEQAAEQRALAKRASVAVLGKRRMIRGRGFKAQSAKPAVREIEVHLSALGMYARRTGGAR